jgi:hypothetical protein
MTGKSATTESGAVWVVDSLEFVESPELPQLTKTPSNRAVLKNLRRFNDPLFGILQLYRF